MRTLLSNPYILIAVLLAAGVGVTAWVLSRPAPVPGPGGDPPPVAEAPPDPRLTFPTQFRNVRPDVHYVGDASCARCHQAIDKTYHAHPMGRSAEWGVPPGSFEKLGAEANNPFRSGPFELRAERGATGMTHRMASARPGDAGLPAYAVAADVAIGSGTRGRSYLSAERGALWQSPLSWFSDPGRWDVSPSFDLGNGGRRAIIPGCMFCHVDRIDPIPGATNRYREPFPAQAAIGCERCHGPGSLHATERAAGIVTGIDTSIVNPKHLSADLRANICEQCHLQGQERVERRGRNVWEFRPGLPFEQFVTVFARHPDLADAHRSVGQFEQMEQSRCFTAGGKRLECGSCHEPHSVPAPAARDAYYRSKCMNCHDSKGCSAPAANRAARSDSCIACHMPRTGSSNVAHASVTDHRIVRRPGPAAPPKGLAPGAIPLVAFRAARPTAPPEPERDRDLGIALARVSARMAPEAGRTQRLLADLATERLTRSLDAWPNDTEAWIELGVAHGAVGDPDGQYRAAIEATRLAPVSEAALTELARSALASGRFGEAATAAESLVTMNPTAIEPYLLRATARMRIGEWERAEADCRAALTIQPLHVQSRAMLGVCRHHRGDVAGGRKEVDTAAGLTTTPRQRERLLEWYRQATQ